MKTTLSVLLLLLFASTVQAQTVLNPSFEATATLDQLSTLGAWRYGGIPNWTVTGQGGLWQPATSEYATLPDGKQVAWSNGGTISQDLGQAPQLNTTYTLTVAVGHRADATSADTYTISLYPGCSTSGNYSTIPAGTFQDVPLVCTPTTQISGNLIVSLATPGPQIDFDNVRLAVKSAVPPQPTSVTVKGQLLWCALCDGTDNTPATGNLLVAQTGGPTSTSNFNADGTVAVSGTIDLSQNPLEFVVALTDANGVTVPGQAGKITLPPGTIVHSIGLGTVRLSHITVAQGGTLADGSTCSDPAGCPSVKFVDMSSFSIGK